MIANLRVGLETAGEWAVARHIRNKK